MRTNTTLHLLITLILLVLCTNTDEAVAEQEAILRFSPIIIVDSNQSIQDNNSGLLLKGYTSSQLPAAKELHLAKKKPTHVADIEKHAVTLGATLHINDNLNIGAACGVQLLEEEDINMKDVSIATMVTMQF